MSREKNVALILRWAQANARKPLVPTTEKAPMFRQGSHALRFIGHWEELLNLHRPPNCLPGRVVPCPSIVQGTTHFIQGAATRIQSQSSLGWAGAVRCQRCQSAASIWICHRRRTVCCISKCTWLIRKHLRLVVTVCAINRSIGIATSSRRPAEMNCLQDCWSLLSLTLSCLI